MRKIKLFKLITYFTLIDRWICLISLLSAHLLLAQNEPYEKSFTGYSDYLSKNYGIQCEFPKGFEDLNEYFVANQISENASSGWIYGPIMETRDKECLLMYPALLLFTSKSDREWNYKIEQINKEMKNETSTTQIKPDVNNLFPRSQIESEIKASMGLVDGYGDTIWDAEGFNLDDYITVISGEKAKSKFNADSVYIYNIPLDKPFREKYTYRVGMILSKKNRVTMLFKWYFTEKGKLNDDQYIRLINNTINYKEEFKYVD